jgi:hypothetical protein
VCFYGTYYLSNTFFGGFYVALTLLIMATLELYWWRKMSGAPYCIISSTNGYLSRTTDVPFASWIASTFERTNAPFGILTYSGDGKVFRCQSLDKTIGQSDTVLKKGNMRYRLCVIFSLN